MVVVMMPGATAEQIEAVSAKLKSFGFTVHPSAGTAQTVLGAIGAPTGDLDHRDLTLLPGVQEVVLISKPYKMASRTFHPSDTVVDVAGVRVGGYEMVVMAGPCAIESREQVFAAAAAVRAAGAQILRGGAFKPRTSPYAFQGMGEEGLKILREASDAHGMANVTEVMEIGDIELISRYSDLLQVGTRNMQNFPLLKALGKQDKPVLLKRGISAYIEELLTAAEYIMSGGNVKVILCERGVRTFEPLTRNTLDLSAIPLLRKLTHLPVIVDPSHATGLRYQVAPMARAAMAAGAHGLIIEVHPNPKEALCDGAQSLTPESFSKLMENLRIIAPAVDMRPPRPPRQKKQLGSTHAFQKAVIVGMGLMGGSLSLALKGAGAVKELVGMDRAQCLDAIKASGASDKVFPLSELPQALEGAELVVLAAPVAENIALLDSLAPLVKAGTIMTDLSGTKSAICTKAGEVLPEGVIFLGGHPMTGSERAGIAWAEPLLFENSVYVLTPQNEGERLAAGRLTPALEAIGAQVVLLDVQQHDRIAAMVSHMPHLMAVAVTNAVGRFGQEEPFALRLAAGGFRDLTRTASSPYAVWRDVLGTNREAVKTAIEALRRVLDILDEGLDDDALMGHEFDAAAAYKLGIPMNAKGFLSPMAEVSVRITDEVGALAAVTTTLAREGLNIKDLQVLKVREQEDGVLRVAFAVEDEANKAVEVLCRAGHDASRRGD